MNLVKTLLQEHSRATRDRVVAYVGESPARFAELVRVFLLGPYRVTQRAAWPLAYCAEHYPELVKPHLRNILRAVSDDSPVAVKRNVVRIFQFADIPKALQGRITEMCFAFLSNRKESVAVRAFSMTVLARIALLQPDLKNEIVILIEEQLPYGSAGFVNRGNKVLNQLGHRRH
jgi:hypothetical protein